MPGGHWDSKSDMNWNIQNNKTVEFILNINSQRMESELAVDAHYIGITNSSHFWGSSLVAIVLEEGDRCDTNLNQRDVFFVSMKSWK